MALGNIAPAADVVKLSIPIRPVAAEGHTVLGVNHNLLIMNMLAAKNYIIIFDKDKVSIYNVISTQNMCPGKPY